MYFCFLSSLPLPPPPSHNSIVWVLPVISLLLTITVRWGIAYPSDRIGFVGAKKKTNMDVLVLLRVIPRCIGLSKYHKREPGYTWRLKSHEYFSMEPEPYKKAQSKRLLIKPRETGREVARTEFWNEINGDSRSTFDRRSPWWWACFLSKFLSLTRENALFSIFSDSMDFFYE